MKCTNKLCWYHDTDYKDNCELIITDCKFLKMHNDEIRWIKRQKKLARIPAHKAIFEMILKRIGE